MKETRSAYFRNIAHQALRVLSLTWIVFVYSGCMLSASISIMNKQVDRPNATPTPIPLSISYTDPTTYYIKGTSTALLIPAISGSPTSLSISPSLPSGLIFDSTTGIISGTPTSALAPTTFTVTAVASDGSTATAPLNFEVAIPFTVTTTTDAPDLTPGDEICQTAGSQCSVRAALEEGAALTGVLSLVSVPAGTYTLSSTLNVNSRIELTGGGAGAVFSGGNTISPVVNISNFPVTMDNFSVNDGQVTTAIAVTGVGMKSVSDNLVLKNCKFNNNTITMNTGTPDIRGVGLSAVSSSTSTGSIVVDTCEFTNNGVAMGTSASFGQTVGIGARLSANSVTIRNSLIKSNIGSGGPNSGFYQVVGAGIFLSTNNARIESTTFDSNIAVTNPDWDTAGGLYLTGAGTAIIEDLVCKNNQASRNGGCMHLVTAATTSITRASVTSNRDFSANGGGITLDGDHGPVTILDSYFDSGVLFSNQLFTNFLASGTLTVKNSTFFSDMGTPVFLNANDGNSYFENCSFITRNGFAFRHSSTVGSRAFIKNSIFEVRSGGSGSACLADAPEVTSEGYNIARGTTCNFLNAGLGDMQNTDPQIAAPALNGGTTKTAALAATSPAVDAIPSASCLLTTDQRGDARPRGAGCDIGAYEY